MKKSIGILYICTGPYALFWKDFFESFEKNFMLDTKKYYYVFTDAKEIYMEKKCDRIRRYHLEAQPWPLVTLLRFHTFLSIREELEKHDFLMFSNANIICNSVVTEEEFLPNESIGEELCFTHHPGYYNKKTMLVPYDRNRKCTAYVPYNCGKFYVIGAMFGGTSCSFIEMSEILSKRINEDLKAGIIAKWHDESHINKYIINKTNFKLLNPGYCYPVGFDVPCEKKILGVSKEEKFDVNSFKGYYSDVNRSYIKKFFRYLKKIMPPKEYVPFIKDTVLLRKVKE